MPTSRRGFLKNTAIIGAGAALEAIPGVGAAQAKGTLHETEQTAGAPHTGAAEEFTRGIGIYPGDPREDFSPELVLDKASYRNLALLRRLITRVATTTISPLNA